MTDKPLELMTDEELLAYYHYSEEQAIMYDIYQLAMKILINSLYGALGTNTFRYYDRDLAEAITTTGRVIIQYIARCSNAFLGKILNDDKDYVTMSDTDSIALCLAGVVQMITKGKEYPVDKIVNVLDAFSKKEIEVMMKKAFQELSDYTNSVVNKTHMKREAIATAGIWRAKKNYIMNIIDNEGVRYATPKLKMMGVETARKATPKFIKNALEDVYRILLAGNEDEYISYITAFRKSFMKMDYQDISLIMGVNNIEKYMADEKDVLKGWISGTPFNVKAALCHNMMLKRLGIANIKPIVSGDRIKMIALNKMNSVGNEFIGYVDELPEQFDMKNEISYYDMYEKLFLSPVESFGKLVDWKSEKKLSVDSLFD